jgi:hypothetical protein
MSYTENRAAEGGSQILTTPGPHTFKKPVIAIRILEATVIKELLGQDDTEGLAYYNDLAMTTDSPIILGNITSVELTSGAVQVIFK